MNSSQLDILSSSPVDHVDISDHSSKELETVINRHNDDADDLTDNEIESEWNWEQDGKENEENDETKIEMQPLEMQEEKLQISTISVSLKDKPRPKIDDNIDDLDIKNKKLTKLEEQAEDFFSDFDMTPTIQKASNSVVESAENQKENSSSSRLQMSMIEPSGDDNDGWGESWNEEL